MWEKLKEYLKNKKVLEIGCGIGQKTMFINEYTDKLTSIDIAEENIKIAKQKFEKSGVIFLTMNAANLDFEDKSFDVVITTDSFHEINPEIQNEVLKEMARVSNTIIFIEPDEVSVTNELFKVFDPNEDHSSRIKKSMNKAFLFMKQNNYILKDSGEYVDTRKFKQEEEMYNTILDWWNDIKIPKDNEEKRIMIND